MYGMSFLVPADQMTLTDQRQYKERAIAQGVSRLGKNGLGLVTNEDGVMVRAIRANADFLISVAGQDEWILPLAAGINAGVLNVIGRPANQIVVFYGIDDYDPNPVATLVTFGTAAVGGVTKAVVDLQVGRGWMDSACFLAEPIVYDPQDIIYVTMEAIAAHNELCAFLGYIFEPRTPVVG